jgi:hypothetical protein
MSINTKQGEIWSRLDELSAQEIIGLVEAAVVVIQSGWEGTENLYNAPPRMLTSILQDVLGQKGVKLDSSQAKLLISQSETSLAISRKLLSEIICFPELANEVEIAYNARQKMMLVEPVSWLLAGALLVLAIKVQKIDLKNKNIKFYALSDKAVEAVGKLLGAKVV